MLKAKEIKLIREKNATLEQWKALYQAAAEFAEIKPWEWMTETDIFGVRNPATGETGYCCIMGELGEVLAMAVYLGTEGLQGYMNIIEGLVGPDDPDSMFSQNCLMVSFEGSDGLEKEDRALIKKLGLKFSGKRAWPLFNRYEPGFLPSPVNGQDVNYLTVVLQQAKDVCLRFKENEGLLGPPEKGLYMVRVQDIQGNWLDSWLEPATVKTISGPAPIDELRIQKIMKIARPSPAVWEVDFFYAPTPIEAARPYYPYAIMVADSSSGFIHDMQLTDRSKYRTAFPGYFLSCIENTGMVPSEILVRREEVFELLQQFVMKFNIALRKVSELKAIDEARRSMTENLQSGGLLSDDYCGGAVLEEYLDRNGPCACGSGRKYKKCCGLLH